jgi:predicted amidohydrolase YtcJ
MKKKILWVLCTLLIGVGYWVSTSDYDHSNDTIYYNGDIITMKDSAQTVQAIYVKNGKIMEVGNQETVFKLKNNHTQLIDLQGKTLMPGFFDAHGHLDFATIKYDMVNISGFTNRTPESVWRIVRDRALNAPKGEWIFYHGLDPILSKGLESPTLSFLDSIAPNNPIVLITQAAHVFYANSRAFSELGITDKTPNPTSNSYYERDANGKLTGAIIEQAALEPFRLKLQQKIKASFAPNSQKMMQRNASKGITSIITMGVLTANKQMLMLYEHLSAEKPKPLTNLFQFMGKLPKRVPITRHFLYLREADHDLLPKSVQNGDDFFKIMGIKLWYDGSPYSGSMYLRQAYARSNFTINGIHLNPNHHGEGLLNPDTMQRLVTKYQSAGWKMAIHCQGDRAIDEAMQAFENLHKQNPLNTYRHRLEHCMLLDTALMASMRKMNITPSFHINHVLYYGDFLKSDILGDERAEKVFPIHSFSKQNVPFSLHSDQPQYEADPLSLASTAVNRQTEAGSKINAKEGISVWEALKSITIHVAWQLHMEDKLGSIEKGKYADLVILDKNPLKIEPQKLASIRVLETIVAGKRIF